jgi:hypothetical protein
MCSNGTGEECNSDPTANIVANYVYESGKISPAGSCLAQFGAIGNLTMQNTID